MQTVIPKTSAALTSLLRADFKTQWRNRRSVVLLLLVPVIILISWKGLIAKVGGAFVLSTCITIGLTAIGLMGYSNAIARDRDKGVFQRLRVTPVPTWSIMGSRLIVQLILILIVTTAVFVVGSEFDEVNLTPAGYALTYLTAFVGGALYLSLGQMIVGLVKNAETVNSTTRLVYFVFIMVGMLGDVLLIGNNSKSAKDFANIIRWSPYGTVKAILAASMQPSNWSNDTSLALLASIGYAVAFSYLGIKNFRWNSQ
ncbi:MAG TPA: ABC transporter permease [Chitinophagaceae bacterium]